jgi:hypothetical protein
LPEDSRRCRQQRCSFRTISSLPGGDPRGTFVLEGIGAPRRCWLEKLLLKWSGLRNYYCGGPITNDPELPVVKAATVVTGSATSITVTESKATKTLTINQFTEIIVNGEKATAADLKPGMTANVTLGLTGRKPGRIGAAGK